MRIARAPVELDVPDHESDDRVVGQGAAEVGEDLADERQVRLAVVGVVERGVDRRRVLAEEPRPQPVVVAVLHDPQIRRRGDDESSAIRQARRAQGDSGPRRRHREHRRGGRSPVEVGGG